MKKRRWLVSVLLVFLMVLQIVVPLKTTSSAVVTERIIPIEAQTYAYKHYKEAVKVVKSYGEYYKVSATQLKDVQLGNPFVIYDLDKSIQDEIYYYPLLDTKGNVILLMSVMGTTEGWSISVSEEWIDELKQIGNINSEFIFYKSGDNLYAEDSQNKFCLSGGIDSKINTFSNKTY